MHFYFFFFLHLSCYSPGQTMRLKGWSSKRNRDAKQVKSRTVDVNLVRQIEEEAIRLGATCLLILSDREFNTEMPTVRLNWAFVSA